MATKTLYVKDKSIWELATRYAAITNTSVSTIIEQALDDWLRKHLPDDFLLMQLVDTLMQAGYDSADAHERARRILFDK